jgi:hypothetical protein
MAGFEIVVRPVVFPNIRPAPARSLPPLDDPEKGFAVIKGNGAKVVSLSYSYSASWSKSRPTESERRVDEARIYQMDDDGTVNRANYIDVEAANRIKMQEEMVDTGTNKPGMTGTDRVTKTEYYRRMKEAPNIEIRNRDQIRKNDP